MSFVDHVFVDDLRIRQLDGVFRGGSGGCLCGQRCRRAETSARTAALELIAHGQRVFLPQLQIDARRNLNARRGVEYRARNRDDVAVGVRGNGVEAGGCIQNRCTGGMSPTLQDTLRLSTAERRYCALPCFGMRTLPCATGTTRRCPSDLGS